MHTLRSGSSKPLSVLQDFESTELTPTPDSPTMPAAVEGNDAALDDEQDAPPSAP